MKFDTGRFLIKNADSGNLVVLPDANQGTDLAGAIPGLDDSLKGEKWNIVLLSTKKVNKYKIQNFDFAGYASCDAQPAPGHNVRGKVGARQWTIKETNRPGHYTISTGTDPELFWGLPDDEDGTPLELSVKGSDPHNQWTFERVSDLEDCIRDIAGDNRAQCLKALNDFPSLAATQLDTAIQDGGLAAVISLLSHSDSIIQSTASTTLTTLAFTVFPHIVVDLYEWKSITSQTRALQKIVDFALADQIKAAAVGSNLIPHLVRLLNSDEDTVVCKSVEALTVLMGLPGARTVAHEAQAGPVLQRLVKSESVAKDAAQVTLALFGVANPAAPTSHSTTLYSPSLSSADSAEQAKKQTKGSDTLVPPLDSDTTPLVPTSDNKLMFVDVIGGDATFGDQGDLDSSIVRRNFAMSLKTGISEPGNARVPTDASVPSLVAFLKGKDSATWGAAACGLRDATQDNANAQNLAFALDILPALVEILRSDLSDTSVLGYVVETLSNIVVFDDETKVTAVDSGVIPPLVHLLHNPAIHELAVIALRILSRNTQARSAIAAAGAVPVLVRLLEEREENVTRISTAGALANIASGALAEVVWEAGPIPHLLGMLYDPDTKLHPSSTAALQSLTGHAKARVEIARHLSRIVELLSSDQLIVRTNAASMLSNICAASDFEELAIKAGVIPPLVQLIQSAEDLNTLKIGVSSLMRLSIALPTARPTLALSGCVSALVKFLDSDDTTLLSNSAVTLWSISVCWEGKQCIADAGGIPPLVKLLSDKDHIIQHSAVTALWRICTLGAALREGLLRAGCLPSLIKLLDSDNIQLRMRAAAVLWNIFIDKDAAQMGIELKAIAALLRLMMNEEMDYLTRGKAAGALQALSIHQGGRIAIATAGGIGALITCLHLVYPTKNKRTEAKEAKTDNPTEEKAKKLEDTVHNDFIIQVCHTICHLALRIENGNQAVKLGAVPKLIHLLRHPSPQVCGAAADTLLNIAYTGSPKSRAVCQDAIPALRELLRLGDEHNDVKQQAEKCLTALARPANSTALALPPSAKWKRRWWQS